MFSNSIVTILPGEEKDFLLETSEQFLKDFQKKATSTQRQEIMLSGTEQDLLAHYLKNKRSFPEQMKSDKEKLVFFHLDGAWEDYITKRKVILKKESDKNSYFIDELVKRELLLSPSLDAIEIAKELLSFDRLHRRIISDAMGEFLKKSNNLSRRYLDINGTGILFVFYSTEMESMLIDSWLNIVLERYCVYTGYKNSTIILIAINGVNLLKIAMKKDIKPFPKKKEEQVKAEIKKMGWFTNHQETYRVEKEYPEEQ